MDSDQGALTDPMRPSEQRIVRLHRRTAERAVEIELVGIRKAFDGRAVLDGIDLAVHRGEFFSLLGPSGCGKTTLLRIMAGFETPDAGSVRLRDTDVTALPAERRPINTVFQSYALFPHMSVFDNVAFGLRMRRIPRRQIDEQVDAALRLVEITQHGRRKPEHLSGGERQRVALARALVNEPQVVLLDEPLSALDRQLRQQLQVELVRLQSRLKLSFVFVTHDQNEALSMSDRVAVLNAGRIEQLGRVEDVYDRPASGFVARFLGASNVIVGEVESPRVVTTPLGSFTVGAPLPARGAVALSIRPQKLLLLRRPLGEGNLAQGRISDVLYYGSGCEYRLRTGSGHELRIDQPCIDEPRTGDSCNRFFEVGEAAFAHLPPHAFVVLERA